MMNKEFLLKLAELEVAFRFHFDGTGMLFRGYEKKSVPSLYDGNFLTADLDTIRIFAKEQHCSMPAAEYNCLLTETADFLVENDRAMFHGVAFKYGGGAYILTAPSGTGKSTQFYNLRSLYGDRCRIINGDKPLLGYDKTGRIIVYPGPWNGKEGWSGKDYGPLRGLVFLEQGQNNKLDKMDKQDAVVPIIEQFIYSVRTRQSVHTVCRMADNILRNVKLAHFINRGDLASSSMLFDFITRTEELWQ